MNEFLNKRQSRPTRKLVIIGGVLVLLALIAFLIYLGKGKSKYEGLDEESVELLVPQITGVTLDPPVAYSVDSLRAVPVLKRPLNHVVYLYQWFVNGDEIPKLNTNLLDNKYFRRGDKIYCTVLATLGKYQSEAVESPSITIQNASPIITLTTVEPFNIPGRFQYQITASDADGDALTYQLVSPLNRGITIDKQTGLIQWDIPALSNPEIEGEAAPSVQVTITFLVKDSAGETTSASLNLNLSKGREDPV